MRKIFTLLTMLLTVFSLNMWADTETPGNTGESNASVIGKSYTIDGKYVAGKGGVKQGSMASKGIKLRSNQADADGNYCLVINVNAGYEISAAKIVGCSNDKSTAVEISKVTVDGVAQSATTTLPISGGSASGEINLSGITAKDNITLYFGAGAQKQIVLDLSFTYEQKEVIVQEITSVAIAGTNLSDADLATLKSAKELTLSGVSYNGVPGCDVVLSSGATSVTRTIAEGNVTFSFKINGTEEYTITAPIEAKEYSGNGVIVAAEEGMTTNDFEVDGIALAMTATDKNFTPGAAKMTIDGTEVPCLKLSTGCGVNVTLPEGKVAKKITVYGWSVSNNGKLTQLKESEESTKSVDVSNDIFLSGNNKDDIYPSVYTYELNNWESIYFTAAGSPSQPCVVLDIELADKPAAKVEVTNISLSIAEGEDFDEDGDFRVIFNYTATKLDESVKNPAMSFRYSVYDSENNPIVDKKLWDANFNLSSRNIYLSGLEGSTQYTIKIDELAVKVNTVVGEDVVTEELLKLTEGLPTLTFTTPEKVVTPVEISNMKITCDKNALIDEDGDYEMAFNYATKINDETLTAADIYATFSYEVYDEVYDLVASGNRDFYFTENSRSFYPSGLTAGKSYTVAITGIKVYGKGTDPILEVTSDLPKKSFKVKDPNAPQAISMSNMSFTVAEGEKLDEDSEFKITFNYTATINDASAINYPYPAMTWEIVDEEGTKVESSVADFYIDSTSRNVYGTKLVEGKTYTIKATKIEIQDLMTMDMLCETTQNLPTLTFTVGSTTGINDATSAEVKAVKKYIKNGKIVIEKNGKKYGVNALEVK